MRPHPIEERLHAAGALPVLRHPPADGDWYDLAALLIDEGVPVLELTTTLDAATDVLAALHERFGEALTLGLGTILRASDVDRAVAAGARFVVSPHLDERLVEAARAADVLILPGTFTPTEVHRAIAAGAEAVKLFPAEPMGVAYLSALRGPFPDVRFYPTGGITPERVPAYLRAGARAVGLGSALLGGAPWSVTALRPRLRALRAAIDETRGGTSGDPD